MIEIIFEEIAMKQYQYWVDTNNQKILKKINKLTDDILLHPSDGIGKPEQLKNNYSGLWSRRIDKEHRLVYKVEKDIIIIVQCRYHYK
jgi:toxin YoeB